MNKITDSRSNSICHIKLNNPEKRNALDLELMTELTQTLKTLAAETTALTSQNLKAVVLSGEGKSFCAGADLNWMKSMADYSLEENIQDSRALFDLFNSIYNCPIPVIVKAHGHVFGGGLGLLAAADYVLAEEDTMFCFSEVKLGLAPAVISSFVMAKSNGSLAQALMTSGLTFNANEALQLGLVHKVSSAKLLDSNFDKILKTYQGAGQEGLIVTKKLCKLQQSFQPESFKDLTIKEISKLRTSSEAQSRMKKFLNK